MPSAGLFAISGALGFAMVAMEEEDEGKSGGCASFSS